MDGEWLTVLGDGSPRAGEACDRSAHAEEHQGERAGLRHLFLHWREDEIIHREGATACVTSDRHVRHSRKGGFEKFVWKAACFPAECQVRGKRGRDNSQQVVRGVEGLELQREDVSEVRSK